MRRLILLLMLVPAMAPAQVRTFVSTNGVDNATCDRTAPCRFFNAAIDAVLPAGEVVALDSGGYGPVVIDKSVSLIVPPGLHASIAATAGNSVNVDGDPTANVTIRNLHITALGAVHGILASDFQSLLIDSCVVSQAFLGISVQSGSDEARVSVTDSTVRNCGNNGFQLLGGDGILHASANGLRVLNNGANGLVATFNTRMVCIDCEAHGNAHSGFAAFAGGNLAHLTEIVCEGCVASRNASGFNATTIAFPASESRIRLIRSVAVGNRQKGATGDAGGEIHVLSGTNMIDDNPVNLFGSVTVIPGDNP